MKAMAVVLVLGLAGLVGARPSGADVVDGTKQFKRDCVLHMEEEDHEGESRVVQDRVDVWDTGTECVDYLIRAVSLTTDSGYHGYNTLENYPDLEDRPDLERLEVLGDYVGMRVGGADVFIPSLGRCDRYHLDEAGEVRFFDSRPCSGPSYPPGVKAFKKDCGLALAYNDNRGPTAELTAKDAGSECDQYTIVGASVVTTNGTRGLSVRDEKADADLEELFTSAYGIFLYGTVNVYIPYRARCDQYRLYQDRTVRQVSSYPCPTEP
jgi:hypothetical protein